MEDFLLICSQRWQFLMPRQGSKLYWSWSSPATDPNTFPPFNMKETLSPVLELYETWNNYLLIGEWRNEERNSKFISRNPTCAVAGDEDDWTATSRPSWDDLMRFTWLQSSPSSTLLVEMEVGIRQMEAVGARNEWRFTSTRWQELYSLSDFFSSFLCLLHSLSDLTLSGLNVKIFGNFFSKCGWFLAEQALTSKTCELNTTLTETKKRLPSLPFSSLHLTKQYLKLYHDCSR